MTREREIWREHVSTYPVQGKSTEWSQAQGLEPCGRPLPMEGVKVNQSFARLVQRVVLSFFAALEFWLVEGVKTVEEPGVR